MPDEVHIHTSLVWVVNAQLVSPRGSPSSAVKTFTCWPSIRTSPRVLETIQIRPWESSTKARARISSSCARSNSGTGVNRTPSKRTTPLSVPSHKYPSRVWFTAKIAVWGNPGCVCQIRWTYWVSLCSGLSPEADGAHQYRTATHADTQTEDPQRGAQLLLG